MTFPFTLCHTDFMELNDLQETASLARLNMGEKELLEFFPAFQQRLSFFALMQAADQCIAAASSAPGSDREAPSALRLVSAGFFRPDTETGSDGELTESLLARAGERDGSFVVIPNVL